jgi:hypothetical protein
MNKKLPVMTLPLHFSSSCLPFFAGIFRLTIGVLWLSRLQFVSAPTVECARFAKKLGKSAAKLAKACVKIN